MSLFDHNSNKKCAQNAFKTPNYWHTVSSDSKLETLIGLEILLS